MTSGGVDGVGGSHDGQRDRVEDSDGVVLAVVAEVEGLQRLLGRHQIEQMQRIHCDAFQRQQQPEQTANPHLMPMSNRN